MSSEKSAKAPELSVVVPAHNEEGNLPRLISRLRSELEASGVSWEIVLVDDNSSDGTSELVDRLQQEDGRIRGLHRRGGPGFGLAIRDGLMASRGHYLVPFMADLSDQPSDLVALYRKGREGFDVVYGSRFVEGGQVVDYPEKKLLANRAYNALVAFLFGLPRKDITNAFKCYRRRVLEAIGLDTLKSEGFDITVELPIRAHILGYSSVEVPVAWHGRTRGVSKLRLATSGPSYGRRLISMFLKGNLLAVGEVLGETLKISRLKLLGSFLAGLLILFAMLLLLDFEVIVDSLSRVSFGVWLLACVAMLLSFIFRTWRWSVMLRTTGSVIRRDLIFSTILFGWFTNYVLPARIGDLARALILRTASKAVSASVALSTIVVERFLDIVTLACLFALSSWLLGTAPGAGLAIGAGFVLVLLALAVVVLAFAPRLIPSLPGGLARFNESLESMSSGVRSMVSNREAFLLSATISIPVWLLEVSVLYFAAASIGTPLGPGVVLLAATSTFMVQSIPVTPAGIGVHEATVTGVLGLFGVQAPEAMAVAVLDHVARAGVIYLFGLVSIFHIAITRRSLSAGGAGPDEKGSGEGGPTFLKPGDGG